MAKHKEEKTNVVRILEAAGIPCTAYEVPLEKGQVPDGVTAARLIDALGGASAVFKEPEEVFKTLVAQGPHGEHFVFVIPVAETLDLKKAARAAGVKSIAMLPQKKLLPLTGYVHGGCSPVGMSKHFPTYFAEEVILVDTMICSAGKVGHQVEVAPDALIALVDGQVADLTVQ